MNNTASSVSKCECGAWFNNHASGKCKVCRGHIASIKASFARIRRTRRQPVVGSAEWAETRGDDLGYSGDY